MLIVSIRRQTLRWESSLWLNGRQVYLGGFATEQEAAHAYDLAAFGCKGPNAEINFPLQEYAEMSTQLEGLSQVYLGGRQQSQFLCLACQTFRTRAFLFAFCTAPIFA